tara:strand:- start:56486 stop:57766 length:1281 start_codon:yes stop_codon:yes gene_type:complete
MSVKISQKNIDFAVSIVDSSPEVWGFENLQMNGYGLLLKTPFPSLRDEYWKYTKVSGLLKKEFRASPKETASLSDATLELVGTNPRIVFVNGMVNPELSVFPTDENLRVTCLSSNKITEDDVVDFPLNWENEHEAFTLLNQSSFTDGAYIEVAKNSEIKDSLYLIHLSTGTNVSVAERNYVKLNQGSKATFINVFEGDNETSFSNHFNSILVDENATINWFDYHQDGENAQSITTTIAHQEANSHVNASAYIFGGKMIRKNFYGSVLGQNCETTVNGAYILNNKQIADYRVIVDHKAAHCNSNQMFKGVMGDNATGVFNGKIYVRKDSQLINAFQTNRNILLSDDANAFSRPQLEIYADDVKCSHGSTIGQLDEDALFYMMARGIRKLEAEKLLVSAFAADAMDNINDAKFKETVLESIATKSEKL